MTTKTVTFIGYNAYYTSNNNSQLQSYLTCTSSYVKLHAYFEPRI